MHPHGTSSPGNYPFIRNISDPEIETAPVSFAMRVILFPQFVNRYTDTWAIISYFSEIFAFFSHLSVQKDTPSLFSSTGTCI